MLYYVVLHYIMLQYIVGGFTRMAYQPILTKECLTR